MNYLCPSILAADFWELGKQIELVEQAGAPYLHIDVMDGCALHILWNACPRMRAEEIRTFYGCTYDGRAARALY